MKLKIILVIGLVCLVALSSARPVDDYVDNEDEPAPPPKKAPARSSLIGRRNPLTSRNTKASSTTPPPPQPAEEEVEEEGVEEDVVPETELASSTTEAPKKFLKAGVVRPFRSNDELLATLKRRREQAATHKQHTKSNQASEAEESAPAPVQNEPSSKISRANGGRRRYSGAKNSEAAAPAEEASSTAAPARTGRRFNSRS